MNYQGSNDIYYGGNSFSSSLNSAPLKQNQERTPFSKSSTSYSLTPVHNPTSFAHSNSKTQRPLFLDEEAENYNRLSNKNHVSPYSSSSSSNLTHENSRSFSKKEVGTKHSSSFQESSMSNKNYFSPRLIMAKEQEEKILMQLKSLNGNDKPEENSSYSMNGLHPKSINEVPISSSNNIHNSAYYGTQPRSTFHEGRSNSSNNEIERLQQIVITLQNEMKELKQTKKESESFASSSLSSSSLNDVSAMKKIRELEELNLNLKKQLEEETKKRRKFEEKLEVIKKVENEERDFLINSLYRELVTTQTAFQNQNDIFRERLETQMIECETFLKQIQEEGEHLIHLKHHSVKGEDEDEENLNLFSLAPSHTLSTSPFLSKEDQLSHQCSQLQNQIHLLMQFIENIQEQNAQLLESQRKLEAPVLKQEYYLEKYTPNLVAKTENQKSQEPAFVILSPPETKPEFPKEPPTNETIATKKKSSIVLETKEKEDEEEEEEESRSWFASLPLISYFYSSTPKKYSSKSQDI